MKIILLDFLSPVIQFSLFFTVIFFLLEIIYQLVHYQLTINPHRQEKENSHQSSQAFAKTPVECLKRKRIKQHIPCMPLPCKLHIPGIVKAIPAQTRLS